MGSDEKRDEGGELDVLSDLQARWRFARRAALRVSLPDSKGADLEGFALRTAALSDDDLLAEALVANPEEATRRVFENSLVLGRGFAHFFRTSVTIEDLPAIFPDLGSPCLIGMTSAADDEVALSLTRDGCAAGAHGHLWCDWWGEAICGLVLGITGGILHSRHLSRGHGGSHCVDVFHVDPESPRRYGPISDEMRAELEQVRSSARMFDSSFDVEFLGVSEGVLHYQIHGGAQSQVAMTLIMERALHRRLPMLASRVVSPRAVLVDGV